MELQSTLERYALQLKNQPRTRLTVAGVVQKITKKFMMLISQMPQTTDPDRIPIAQMLIFSRSPTCLNISVRIAKMLDIPGCKSNCENFPRLCVFNAF